MKQQKKKNVAGLVYFRHGTRSSRSRPCPVAFSSSSGTREHRNINTSVNAAVGSVFPYVFLRFLPSFAEFYRVLPSYGACFLLMALFMDFYRVLPSFGFTFFRWHCLWAFTEFYRVLGLLSLDGTVYGLLLSFTEFWVCFLLMALFMDFYRVLPSFTEFWVYFL